MQQHKRSGLYKSLFVAIQVLESLTSRPPRRYEHLPNAPRGKFTLNTAAKHEGRYTWTSTASKEHRCDLAREVVSTL